MRIGEGDVCVVIDWRDGAEDILAAVKAFLPPGYLSGERRTDGIWTLSAGGRPASEIRFTEGNPALFVNAVNEILAPEFEIRQFRPIEGDGYSFLLRPSGWWMQLEDRHPDLLEKYFITTERLARYASRSWLGRLFSKP